MAEGEGLSPTFSSYFTAAAYRNFRNHGLGIIKAFQLILVESQANKMQVRGTRSEVKEKESVGRIAKGLPVPGDSTGGERPKPQVSESATKNACALVARGLSYSQHRRLRRCIERAPTRFR